MGKLSGHQWQYDTRGMNLGQCVEELKKIAGEVEYTKLINMESDIILNIWWMKQIIDHMEIPELIGHETQNNNIEA